MELHDDLEIEWPRHSDKTIYLFLSLYLLLLAFFIMLNTISNARDERVAKAVESVKETFQNYSPSSREFLSSAANPDSMIAAEAYLDDIRNVFSAQFQDAKFQRKTNGTLLRVLIPARSLFADDSETLNPDVRSLLDAISTGLGSSRPGTRREVEVIIGTGEQLPDVENVGQVLGLRRSSALARGLRTHGVDGKSVVGGLRQGDTEMVQMTFYVRKLGATGVTFRSGDE